MKLHIKTDPVHIKMAPELQKNITAKTPLIGKIAKLARNTLAATSFLLGTALHANAQDCTNLPEHNFSDTYKEKLCNKYQDQLVEHDGKPTTVSKTGHLIIQDEGTWKYIKNNQNVYPNDIPAFEPKMTNEALPNQEIEISKPHGLIIHDLKLTETHFDENKMIIENQVVPNKNVQFQLLNGIEVGSNNQLFKFDPENLFLLQFKSDMPNIIDKNNFKIGATLGVLHAASFHTFKEITTGLIAGLHADVYGFVGNYTYNKALQIHKMGVEKQFSPNVTVDTFAVIPFEAKEVAGAMKLLLAQNNIQTNITAGMQNILLNVKDKDGDKDVAKMLNIFADLNVSVGLKPHAGLKNLDLVLAGNVTCIHNLNYKPIDTPSKIEDYTKKTILNWMGGLYLVYTK